MSSENAGIVISKSSAAAKQTFFRLKIDCSGDQDANAYFLNRELAEKLISIRPRMRSIQMEKCLVDVLKKLPNNAVVKNVDVLFNPGYKIDVLKVLITAYKQHPFSLIWPGTMYDGKLVYSEEGYPDYHVYEISDYDIICIR